MQLLLTLKKYVPAMKVSEVIISCLAKPFSLKKKLLLDNLESPLKLITQCFRKLFPSVEFGHFQLTTANINKTFAADSCWWRILFQYFSIPGCLIQGGGRWGLGLINFWIFLWPPRPHMTAVYFKIFSWARIFFPKYIFQRLNYVLCW